MLRKFWDLLLDTLRIWGAAHSSRMSAAMTYYTMLSLAPLLVLAIAIIGYVFGHRVVESEIIEQVDAFTNETIAATVEGLMQNAAKPTSGIWAGAISLAILIYSASGVFSQLHDTFNEIWHVPSEKRQGCLFTIRTRLIGIAMVAVAGVLLLATLVVNTTLSSIARMFEDPESIWIDWLNFADRGLSFLLIPLVFTFMFWLVPDTKVRFRYAWPAGLLTALLVGLSRYLIAFYLEITSANEVYGAAGSLVVLLIWVYIIGQVIFLGAAFSHSYAIHFGAQIDSEEILKAAYANNDDGYIEERDDENSREDDFEVITVEKMNE